jgi:hypothetical protein
MTEWPHLGQEMDISAMPPMTPENMMPTAKPPEIFAANAPKRTTLETVAMFVSSALR